MVNRETTVAPVTYLFYDAVEFRLQWRMTGFMNNELATVRKQAVIAYFKVLSQHLPGGTE